MVRNVHTIKGGETCSTDIHIHTSANIRGHTTALVYSSTGNTGSSASTDSCGSTSSTNNYASSIDSTRLVESMNICRDTKDYSLQ